MRDKTKNVGFLQLPEKLAASDLPRSVKDVITAFRNYVEVENKGCRVPMSYLTEQTSQSGDEVLHGLYSAYQGGYMMIRLHRYGHIPKKTTCYRLTMPLE